MDMLHFVKKIRQRAQHPRSFFQITLGIFLLTIFIGAVNILCILKVLPSIAGTDTISHIIKIVIFPSQFLMDEVFVFPRTQITTIAMWAVQFLYDFVLACLIRKIFMRPKKWEGLLK